MTFNLTVWLRNLVRPKTESMRIVIYENDRMQGIQKYDSRSQEEIMKAVQKLFITPKENPYWFEVEYVETRRMCYRGTYPPELYVTCYRQSNRNPTVKVPMNIPIRFRSRMLDKFHSIQPEPVAFKIWPKMEVKFRLLD